MNTSKLNLEIASPKNQLHLFGYESYFNFFVGLFKKKRLPNTMLLSGSKGLGKSTFVYHFANYILSKEEQGEYSTAHFAINKDNLSYKLLCENIHPNFFTVQNGPLEKEIKIDQIRNLLQFLSKSTYSSDLKIILIDNVEYLNLHSASALLKGLEETRGNTFFFIIHNSASRILDTIKSRCIEFNFFFTIDEKKNIFENIANQYFNKFETNELVENLYFDTPGNLIKYFFLLNNENINVAENKLSYIFYLIEKYLNEKNPETLIFLSLFIHKFYNELCLRDRNYVSRHLFNLSKIMQQIDDMKKFNLNEKNILSWIKDILLNETK